VLCPRTLRAKIAAFCRPRFITLHILQDDLNRGSDSRGLTDRSSVSAQFICVVYTSSQAILGHLPCKHLPCKSIVNRTDEEITGQLHDGCWRSCMEFCGICGP
jgi:hypothetical protein